MYLFNQCYNLNFQIKVVTLKLISEALGKTDSKEYNESEATKLIKS